MHAFNGIIFLEPLSEICSHLLKVITEELKNTTQSLHQHAFFVFFFSPREYKGITTTMALPMIIISTILQTLESGKQQKRLEVWPLFLKKK